MIEKHIDIATADDRMDSFVVHPEEGGPFPAVLILMDIWGLREELYDVARKVAAVCYHVTVPNFWYRRGKVRFEYRDEKGRMKSLVAIPQVAQDEMHANMSHLTDGMAMADIGAEIPRWRAGGQRPQGQHRLLPGRPAVACGSGSVSRSVPRVRQHARHAACERQAGFAASFRRQDEGRDLLRLRRKGRTRAALDHRDAGATVQG
jgi:hypothetical protein